MAPTTLPLTAAADAPARSDAERTARIRSAITGTGDDLKARYNLVKHQNAIGAAIMAVAVFGMLGAGAAWYTGLVSAWVSIPVAAVFASLLHELEHDLIHLMYFKKQKVPQNIMLLLCWLLRPLTINPWLRRKLHFHHHKNSGQHDDLEERAITNGERWGVRRLVMLFDGILAIALRLKAAPADRRKTIVLRGTAAYFPVGLLAWATWYTFLGFHLANGIAALAGTAIAWKPGTLSVMHGVDVVTVVLLAPNLLRSFCLNFVSSNMHYFGDIEAGNIVQQTQVLNPWWMTPFQLFCFNFGTTHAIHHFVVGQPFYLRQMVAGKALPVMRANGVRFNDFGTFRRANRWTGVESEQEATARA